MLFDSNYILIYDTAFLGDYMKKVLLSSLMLAVLTACGGGGGDDEDNSEMPVASLSNEVTPSTISVRPGHHVFIESAATASGTTITGHDWSLVSLDSGVVLGPNSPEIVDKECINATGNLQQSNCFTNLIVPPNASGNWKIISTVSAPNAADVVKEIPIKIAKQEPTQLNLDVTINNGQYHGTLALNETGELVGDFDVNTTQDPSTFVFTKEWTQVGGPQGTLVNIASSSPTQRVVSFTPTLRGEYVFKYTVSFTSPVVEKREATFVVLVTNKPSLP